MVLTFMILVKSITLQHKDPLCEEVCLLLAKGFRSQRLAVRKELTGMLNKRWGGLVYFAEFDIQCMYLCCIIYTYTCTIHIYIYMKVKQKVHKRVPLGGPGGML